MKESNSGLKKTLNIEKSPGAIQMLKEAVTDFGKEASLPESVIHDACFALEEIVSNILIHGFEGEAPPRISVSMQRQGEKLLLETRDNGKPFNPLAVPEPDLGIPFEEREPGGLGIFLVKKLLTDNQEYRNENGLNTLKVEIDLSSPPIK